MENLAEYLNKKIVEVMGKGLLENVIVDFIIVTEEGNANLDSKGLILEKKEVFYSIPGVKHYTYRIDKQQGVGGPGHQRHIHIFYDGKELFAMNADSTAHDGYHQVRIPEEIVPFLKQHGFPVPDNHIIEMRVQNPIGQMLICENFNHADFNDLVIKVGEVIRHASKISIIEANLECFQVESHSKVFGKYSHIDPLQNIPQHQVSETKMVLVEQLESMGKCGETLDIFDDNTKIPHSLYIAWNE